MTAPSVVPRHGRGQLQRNGRKPGSKAVVTKLFEEFAKSTLEDPAVQRKIRARLLLELEGKRRNPLPTLAVLASAAVRERPLARAGVSVTFIAEIVAGRGVVQRVELGQEGAALPAGDGAQVNPT